jgi:CBS domain containing-hemolysin-like protein
MGSNLAIWILFGLCLVLSFVFSGMEAGVFALSRLRIRQRMRAGRPSAKVLHQFLENPENFLWTILVGNTLANFLILGWLVVLLEEGLRRRRALLVLVYILVVFLFYALFDLLPKMLFRMHPNRLCLMLARPFRVLHLALRPLVAVVEWFSRALLRWRGGKAFTGHLFGNREELRLLMQESGQMFTTDERRMINHVLDLQTLTVRQVMNPLSLAVTVKAQAPVTEALALCREKKFSRLPVWGEASGTRRLIGLVSCNMLLFQPELDVTKTAGDYVRPALYLEEDLRLEVALRRMQRGGHRLAIVLGRDRREIGIISLQDMLKAIFGEVSL